MTLKPGTDLGTYELLAQIGAGGMGEVYEARDTKLGRNVAIKVLPTAFVNDPERLARFQREARMLAALNHPNIATIYGLEHSDGTHFLIMELVGGETLAERIKREGAVPVEESLKIAVQIAQALEAAHEKGIIHRDLKPANVKVTPEDKVKVLDFGLAKAFAGDAASGDPSDSPTLSRAATMQGVILGTAAYMSPEQARGKAVDKRTDIWAFGCVLYEMLTGKQAFDGEDITEILAAVVRAEPDWQAGTSGLSQVSAAGGKPQAITSRGAGTEEEAHRWPQLLPGGRAVLFTAWTRNVDEAQIVVQRLDTHERRVILQGGTYARYVPSGQLVYAREGNLMAVAFDLSRLEAKGDPIPVVQGVTLGSEGAAQFDIASNGSLVYVPTDVPGNGRRLVWVDRTGKEQPFAAPPRNYLNPRLSPDGQKIALVVQGANDDVWVYDIPHQTLTRLTFQSRSISPLWTPDGRRIVYRSSRAGILNLFWKAADGSGQEERLTLSQNNQVPDSVSPDGQALVFAESNRESNRYDLWILPLAGDRKPRAFLNMPFGQSGASFSPDGHWLAYMSNESGRPEVYVQPFPAGGQKVQVSSDGGAEPRWTRSGELFYRNGDKMMAVRVQTQPTLATGQPTLVFEGQYGGLGSGYDVTTDGQRFLMMKGAEQATSATQINVVLNWFEELKRRVPTGK